jgi:hypothetical protein
MAFLISKNESASVFTRFSIHKMVAKSFEMQKKIILCHHVREVVTAVKGLKFNNLM